MDVYQGATTLGFIHIGQGPTSTKRTRRPQFLDVDRLVAVCEIEQTAKPAVIGFV
jgi:hypothetical protein